AGLTISGMKTYFGMSKVVILGHECSQEGRYPVEEAREKIGLWKVPTDKTQIRSFVSSC
ncbi:hypothetical protein GQ54DRAFT_237447, partial [Martensiomyces pterosporus]